jgi:hypothetical protein
VLGESPAAIRVNRLSTCSKVAQQVALLHANLSGMLPQRPQALDPDFHADFSQSGVACAADAQPLDHHCQVCPTCSHRLTGHRCKLVCTHCGYYLSCADYY